MYPKNITRCQSNDGQHSLCIDMCVIITYFNTNDKQNIAQIEKTKEERVSKSDRERKRRKKKCTSNLHRTLLFDDYMSIVFFVLLFSLILFSRLLKRETVKIF